MGIAGLTDLKKRIKSIEGTKKITKAMALVSTSKLKKVRSVLYVNSKYYKAYNQIISELVPSLSEDNVYIKGNNSDKKLVIVITSDRGMCGGFNNNVLSKLEEVHSSDKERCSLLVIGKRGISLSKRYGFEILDHDLTISDIPTIDEANRIFKYCLEKYLSGEFNNISVIYTWFKNPIIKEVVEHNILPIGVSSSKDENIKEDEFDIEGSREELIDQIIIPYCGCSILYTLLNAKASEQSIRMETMNSANQNADDLISTLTLKYNRIRQGQITQEISEIVGGSQM